MYLLFGILFIGFALLMVATFLAAPPTAQGAMPAGTAMYISLFYLALAVLFGTLGIGSMMARRWAPPLILVVSWGWLICGVVTAAMMTYVLPMTMESMPEAQEGAKAFAIGCMSIGIGLFGVVVPLVFILFYRSVHVQATVQRLDPVSRWTDGQPVSLLVFASWMFFGAASLLLSSFMYKALPVGAFMLRGWPVFAVMAAMATLLAWIGWGTLQRWRSAWWSAVVLLVIGIAWGASMIMTTDPLAMYEAMGIAVDPQQTKLVMAFYSSPLFYGWMATIWIGYFAFLLYLRRYFFARSERSAI